MSEEPTNPNNRGRGRPALARTAPLDRAEIMSKAHEIVRADGLDALNMRRLADELGVTPMAIYHHVKNKKALLFELVNDVWRQVNDQFPAPAGDFDEWFIECALVTRRVWLEHIALVNLSMAVAPADEALMANTQMMALAFEAAGYPDVPLAATAMQNFLLGSIATWANRHVASAFFDRDPVEVLGQARRLLDERDAAPNHRGVLETRFDERDELNFEPALRALLRGLHSAPPPEPGLDQPAPKRTSRQSSGAKRTPRKPAAAKSPSARSAAPTKRSGSR